MRAEGGRNPYLVDLGTLEGVIDLLPAARPERRLDIARRYVTLGPADVDIGFSGRLHSSDPVHARIEGTSWGSKVVVSGKQILTIQGGPVGRLASRTELRAATTPGTVSGILVRTREQTAPEYQSGLKVDRWETVLIEMIVDGEE
jgi:ATP-dependent DNA helicase RecQ